MPVLPKALVTLPRRKAYRSIARYVFDKVRQEGVANLSEQERTIYSIASMHEEILNGGIPQYFTNSFGKDSALAVDALSRIGAQSQGDIVTRSLSLLPAHVHVQDRELVGKFVFGNASIAKELDDLTGRYLASAEALYDSIVGYVLNNLDAFK
jgi:hypothetical protein